MLEPLNVRARLVRRRGGWRQQLAADRRERSRSPPRRSRLAEGVLLGWCDGKVSAVNVRDRMRDSAADGNTRPIVLRLQRLGDSPQRDLLRVFSQLGFDALVTSAVGHTVTDVVLPSTLFKFKHRAPQQLKRHLGADAGSIRTFWDGLLSSAEGQQLRDLHPKLRGRSPRDLQHTIPVTLHEDAGPFSKNKSCYVISWSSVLGCGTEFETKLVYCSSVKVARSARDDECYKLLLRDFDCLACGFVDGSPIAQDEDGTVWKAVLLWGKGDLEVQTVEWGLPSYNAAEHMCGWCKANRSDAPFTNLMWNAPWRESEDMPNEEFMHRLRAPVHPLATSVYLNKFPLAWAPCTRWTTRG